MLLIIVKVSGTHVLYAVIAWHVSPVQNSEIVLYCRLMRLKNVVAVEKKIKNCRYTTTKTKPQSTVLILNIYVLLAQKYSEIYPAGSQLENILRQLFF